MVRRRSTVRFRKGDLERKHGKRHPIRLAACGVAFLFFRLTMAGAGVLRLPAPNPCPSFPCAAFGGFHLTDLTRLVSSSLRLTAYSRRRLLSSRLSQIHC